MSGGLVGVDVGGTFTDVVSIIDGELHLAKVPTDVHASERSIMAGGGDAGARAARVFNVASTAGLNALLTRRLPKVGFLTTQGFRDTLVAGTYGRPGDALTNPRWQRSFADAGRPLVPRYLRRGVKERVTIGGEVLVELDEEQARAEIAQLVSCEVDAIAVCLLHAYANPSHEQRLAAICRDVAPEVPCVVSTDVSPVPGEYGRSVTTVVEAVMRHIYAEYTHRLQGGLKEIGFDGQLNYADSRAMLIPAADALERAHVLVGGGPAAGTIASRRFGSQIGESNLICADVGGTSCDLSLVSDGRIWVRGGFELEHDLSVNCLSTDIFSLGAGGGSVVWTNSVGEVRVGPDSAGADPGPACYDKAGSRPTTTDIALLIGILDETAFLGGRIRLRRDLAEQAVVALKAPFNLDERVRYAWQVGLHNLAEETLGLCLRHGVDPRDHALLAYGAAGPMLLPSLLDLLPLAKVVVPPNPGLFSAIGLISSDLSYTEEHSRFTVLDESSIGAVDDMFNLIESRLRARLGEAAHSARFERSFDGRLVGQGRDTPFVPVSSGRLTSAHLPTLLQSFHDEYQRRNGTRFEALPVEGVTFRSQAVVDAEKISYSPLPARASGSELPTVIRTLRHIGDGEVTATEVHRCDLCAGDGLVGPVVVREETSTTFVPADHQLVVGELGELVIT